MQWYKKYGAKTINYTYLRLKDSMTVGQTMVFNKNIEKQYNFRPKKFAVVPIQ